ncbi:hypothetical protein BASA50_003523 [Batrachochytrium salamandrivorans]|uniref:BHLH domain-containing protein n=1 Tax=Batrachochytrium salamandrivorans TaxID=1357716 RepID=A0ABQ8FHP2_9FUNG|nr:hypothetical protein BASA60_010118 [Batrachochytrium salamandrivorans]KAH6571494.1 hypothetical protein BASA62_003816 [Batrachochytrium salamandrivorans]KAH6598483.1 hypothetical protein BASA50_003523 [Batrachochytrium salamandrivorans]KAH6599114.1 hypothetical protein BASA61_002645 [Batrachochytrium salamandrivorans]KAH9276427.1 hypothetical protein BASA83_001123 [Batrachochytrium salamandrivorans]
MSSSEPGYMFLELPPQNHQQHRVNSHLPSTTHLRWQQLARHDSTCSIVNNKTKNTPNRDEALDKQRKATHSAIERRRRERINDKIAQLKTLLPSCANKSGLHKLTIIEEGIHYIRQLEQHLVLLQSQAQPNLASEPKSVLGSTSASVEITCTSKSSASSKPPPYLYPCPCSDLNVSIKLEDVEASLQQHHPQHHLFPAVSHSQIHINSAPSTPCALNPHSRLAYLDEESAAATALCSVSMPCMLPSPAPTPLRHTSHNVASSTPGELRCTHYNPRAEVMSLGTILS